jgi:hypothetical protein
MQAHSVTTIEEEDIQMGEEVIHAGDPDGYGSQYTSYHREDSAYGEGGYFNDGYSVEKQSYEGDIDEYDEYTLEDRGTTFCH